MVRFGAAALRGSGILSRRRQPQRYRLSLRCRRSGRSRPGQRLSIFRIRSAIPLPTNTANMFRACACSPRRLSQRRLQRALPQRSWASPSRIRSRRLARARARWNARSTGSASAPEMPRSKKLRSRCTFGRPATAPRRTSARENLLHQPPAYRHHGSVRAAE